MICVLHSGGIDSTGVVQYYLNRAKEIQLTFVDYGQVMASTEREHSMKVARFFGVKPPVTLDLSGIRKILPRHPLIAGATKPAPKLAQSFASQYFPNRNLLLLVTASLFCFDRGYEGIALGIIDAGRGYADTNAKFVKLVSALFSDSVHMSVLAPLVNWNKQRVVSYLIKNGFDPAKTFSCNVQARHHCNRCASCIERKWALARFE
jgi:7-cyano-7-deazaguanine synthase